jgi:hypothetical protein
VGAPKAKPAPVCCGSGARGDSSQRAEIEDEVKTEEHERGGSTMITWLLNLFRSMLLGLGMPASAPVVLPPPGPIILSMDAASWDITYSPTMPAHPAASIGGGWYLDFPVGPDGHAAWSAPVIPAVHYVTLPVALNLSGRTSLTAVLKIKTSGDPVFQFKLKSHNVCLMPPASVSLFLQRAGDDMSGAGPMEFYRMVVAAH